MIERKFGCSVIDVVESGENGRLLFVDNTLKTKPGFGIIDIEIEESSGTEVNRACGSCCGERNWKHGEKRIIVANSALFELGT